MRMERVVIENWEVERANNFSITGAVWAVAWNGLNICDSDQAKGLRKSVVAEDRGWRDGSWKVDRVKIFSNCSDVLIAFVCSFSTMW